MNTLLVNIAEQFKYSFNSLHTSLLNTASSKITPFSHIYAPAGIECKTYCK